MTSIVIGTAGHIDHGKSALVRALTGIDPDRLKEEKARGITIDLGFAHTDIAGATVAFVDVPGHERFVKNMLAGASGIDAVLLVIAADESVMPQTREHFDICRLLGVTRGVVVLTKADLVEGETLDVTALAARELVRGSFLDGAPVIAVSARTGRGLDDLRAAIADMAAVVSARDANGAVRLPIDRVFSVKGFGTVVTGTLVSGAIRPDEELVALPGGRRVKVRGVQVHGRTHAAARAGQRAAINLGGVDVPDLARGQTLVRPGEFDVTRRLDAAFDLLPSAPPLRHGARVRVHAGTSELLGRVSAQAAELGPGSRAYIRLRLEAPAVLTRGDRFIVRAYSPPLTIGGGRVLDPQPPRGGFRTAAGLARLQRLDRGGDDEYAADAAMREAVAVMLEERAEGGLAAGAFVSRAGIAPERVDAFIASLEAAGEALHAGHSVISARVLERLEDGLRAALAEYHRLHPLAPGMPREEARERLFARADPAIFDLALDRLARAGQVTGRGTLALAGHTVSLSDEEARAKARIEAAFRGAGLRPPDPAAAAGDLGLAADVTDRVIKLLVREKALVRIETLLFHREALDRLKAQMGQWKAAQPQGARLDVAAFKERYGVTRKFAIPLLEYLDRERITRRVGEARILL